jgi:lysophospholipase L1-like esterase
MRLRANLATLKEGLRMKIMKIGRIRRITRTVGMAASAAISLVVLIGTPVAAGASSMFADRNPQNPQNPQVARHTFSPKYVALGDSVASGLGLTMAPGASAEDIACGRSTGAYSSIVAAKLNEKLSKWHVELDASSAACQGATMDNLVQEQTLGGVIARPQLDAAYQNGAPELLTLTMGSNDVRWAQFIGACFAATNCATNENTAIAQQYINTAKGKLIAVLQEIESRSDFIPPFTIVTGYYNPVSAQCAGGGMTVEETAWLKDQTNALNAALKKATQQHGTGWFTRFASVDFTGHDICSADSWIQRPGTADGPAPFHPTARGQQAIADAVLAKLGL